MMSYARAFHDSKESSCHCLPAVFTYLYVYSETGTDERMDTFSGFVATC